MEAVSKMEHNGETLTIISDERDLFALPPAGMRAIANQLLKAASKLTDKDIDIRNKKALLKDSPTMYPQVYGEDDPLWIEFNKNRKPTEITPKKRSGYIYVIEAIGQGYYKIGFSSDINQRIKELSRSYPFEVEIFCSFHSDDMVKDEKELHEKFKEKRHKSEWFYLDTSDLEEIKQHKEKKESERWNPHGIIST